MAIGSNAAEWVSPSVRPQHIQQLINGVDRYNPQNLEVLHQYLGQQLDHGAYDSLANLAILKLYQFNPDHFNYEVVINILIKAMLALPFPDFKLCLSLLGEAPVQMDYSPLIARTVKDAQPGQEGEEGAKKDPTPTEAEAESSGADKTFLAGNIIDPLILRLANLSNLLSTARFRQFWSTLYEEDNEDVRKFTDNVAGFEEDVRKIVMDTVASTFQKISEERLASYLHLKAGSELREFVAGFKEDGWSVQEDKKIVVAPVNADNEIKAVTINEEISLDQLSRFLQQAQPTPLRAPTNSSAPAPTAVSS